MFEMIKRILFAKKRYKLTSLIILVILIASVLNINQKSYSSMEREDIPQRYKWDLSSVYNSEQEWVEDFNLFQSKLADFNIEEMIVHNSGQDLLDMITFKEEVAKGIERIYVYSLLKSDSDTRNNHYQSLLFKAEGLMRSLEKVISLISIEVANISEERLQELIEEEEGLLVYEDYLTDIVRSSGYLSPKEERIIYLAGGMAGSPRNIFRMINYADKDGGLNQNTRAAILNAKVEKDIFYKRARGYSSVRESRGVPIEAYDALIELVRSNLASLDRYRSMQSIGLSTPSAYKGISYGEAQRLY